MVCKWLRFFSVLFLLLVCSTNGRYAGRGILHDDAVVLEADVDSKESTGEQISLYSNEKNNSPTFIQGETSTEESLERKKGYFSSKHALKQLNSMKCQTPMKAEGFCSTFGDCVPSFFTPDGDLKNPALAELVTFSIGFCTTDLTMALRLHRRYTVADRIICCPGKLDQEEMSEAQMLSQSGLLSSIHIPAETTQLTHENSSSNTSQQSLNGSIEFSSPDSFHTTNSTSQTPELPELPSHKSGSSSSTELHTTTTVQDVAPVIQISANPSQGTNGKFTLENGIHVVSELSETVIKPYESSTYMSLEPSTTTLANNNNGSIITPIVEKMETEEIVDTSSGFNISSSTEKKMLFSSKFSYSESMEMTTMRDNNNNVLEFESDNEASTTIAPSSYDVEIEENTDNNGKSRIGANANNLNEESSHINTATDNNESIYNNTGNNLQTTTLGPPSFYLPSHIESKSKTPIITELEGRDNSSGSNNVNEFETLPLLSLEQDYYPPVSSDSVDLDVHDPSKDNNGSPGNNGPKPVDIDTKKKNQGLGLDIHQEDDDSVESFKPGKEWSIDNLYQQTAVGTSDESLATRIQNLYQGASVSASEESNESFLNMGSSSNDLLDALDSSSQMVGEMPSKTEDSDSNNDFEDTLTNSMTKVGEIMPPLPTTSMGLPPMKIMPVLSNQTPFEEMMMKVTNEMKTPEKIMNATENNSTEFVLNSNMLENSIDSLEVPEYEILSWCSSNKFHQQRGDAEFVNYPWLATIVGGLRPFCSGSLIHPRYVLTAAHFLANITVPDVVNMRIHVGYRKSKAGTTEGPMVIRKVRKVFRHIGFSEEKLNNDIAILMLDKPVKLSPEIHPICLSNENYHNYESVQETGWVEEPKKSFFPSPYHYYEDLRQRNDLNFGFDHDWSLRQAESTIQSKSECQLNYSFLRKKGIKIVDSMICASPLSRVSCSFKGNSGAPLFLSESNEKIAKQVGIVSWGIGCGHFPSVFTKVKSYLPWINRVVYKL